jgi:hypothetical protein
MVISFSSVERVILLFFGVLGLLASLWLIVLRIIRVF